MVINMIGERLGRDFYLENADILAPRLIGKILVRKTDTEIIRSVICETECYMGQDDSACHASKGRTERNSVIFEEGGIAYVYLCYGMHNMLNVVTGERDYPQAVLIRGVRQHIGPGRLTKALDITRELNREVLYKSDRLWIEDGEALEYIKTPRIGIDYAQKKDRERLWRYVAE